jgi:hypothetical protein
MPPLKTGGRPGGSCTAALFLKAFAEGIESKDGQDARLNWAHIDIAGTMEVCVYVLQLKRWWTQLFIGYKANAILGKGHDGSSCSVGYFSVVLRFFLTELLAGHSSNMSGVWLNRNNVVF